MTERRTYSYLGPAGTFTEAALEQVAEARGQEWRPVHNVGEALADVLSGVSDAAMIAIENSIEGGVSTTQDALATLLDYNLMKEGFRVERAADGEEALLRVAEEPPDLVILDWMLPKVSGIEVCRRLRGRAETRNVPIIMLTARGEETDRIRGLDTGADDYVVKPFSMVELTARVRAVLRRIRPGLADDRITVGDIIIDRVAHRVKRDGKEIHLGPTEFRLLDYLMQHPGRVFSREQLLDAVWGSDVYVEARTVDVHIGRLRKALNGNSDGDPIRTVRSAGYSLDLDAA